jgi:ABC-type lipoprotein release transport system permease subunit
MTSVPLLLVALAGLVCLVPGRRAAKLDPAAILRDS